MRKPQVNGPDSLEAAGLLAFASEEVERQFDSFDFVLPVLGDGQPAAGQEVLLDLVEAGQHLGVDAEHRAADAGFSELRGESDSRGSVVRRLSTGGEVVTEDLHRFGRRSPRG
ncbi:hypothetical protein [Streptomyces sp. B27]|uniref:hypothetical protein n=1 Tax=Streptomyces sp. B27 TaxID=2485015 RepID=UPI0013E3E259|nr:hypothetical protein [Streptomyces sp. B27]